MQTKIPAALKPVYLDVSCWPDSSTVVALVLSLLYNSFALALRVVFKAKSRRVDLGWVNEAAQNAEIELREELKWTIVPNYI